MLAAWRFYIQSFQGFSREIWILSFATLINRAGAMVIPFMTLYFTEGLNFDLKSAGWIMSAYGLGSFAGAWIGGHLTDKIGYYKVMFTSLLLSACVIFLVNFLSHYMWVLSGIFLFALVNDIFRPASYVAVAAYSLPGNLTRAITLNRLAINLGFSIGPAAGGLLITNLGYSTLFFVDSATCLLTGLVIIAMLREVPTPATAEAESELREKALSGRYLLFLLALLIFSILFIQYFSTMPVFYKAARGLDEASIGWLLGLNGVVIFLLEMPLIFALDRLKNGLFKILAFSAVLMAASFLVVNMSDWIGMLVIGMLLVTLAEMLCFPYANTYALIRAGTGNKGKAMAYFQMTFSLAHIVGHNLGLQLSDRLPYSAIFNIFIIMSLVCGGLFLMMRYFNRNST